jgi:translation initiation factor IF-3
MSKYKGKNNYRKRNEPQHRINEKIRARDVRLVGDNVEVGIYSLQEALSIASDLDLDLVEINSKSEPPICKAMNYEKFLYDKKKAEKEQKKNQKKNQQKEIRFGPNTGEADLEHKMKNAKKFLEDGLKVKVTVFFKGRTIVHKERGELLLLQFAEGLEDYGSPEAMPKLEGKRMHIFLKPKTKK